MNHPARALLVVFLLTLPVAAQERVDEAMIAKIRAEGLERSHAPETFTHLTTVIGARLTNSPAHRRSIEWTQQQLRSYGLANVHTEPWEFGRGWQLERFSIEMLEPRYLPFKAVGLPGFQAVQDYRNYDVRTHHTNMDTDERVPKDALEQAAVVMASVLYHAANRDAKVPR
jgi:carboxypeptidase Q